jgi:hypothetical protein
VISDTEWRSMHYRYAGELEEIRGRLSQHIDANIDYYEKGSVILELAKVLTTNILSKRMKNVVFHWILYFRTAVSGEMNSYSPIANPLAYLQFIKKKRSNKNGDYMKDRRIINFGVPKGIRTPVAAVKGQCPRPG